MARRLSHWLIGLMVVGLLPLAQPAQAQTERCFPETGLCISGQIRTYWEENGGLAVFGYPITPQHEQVNIDLLKPVATQWFERARLEIHPDLQPPYHVLLGRLGDEGLLQTIRLPDEPAPAQPDCRYFPETGQSVCDQGPGIGFRTYWESHGLQFDANSDVSDAESLALFGLPLTTARMETNAAGHTVLTQWFERARFEWHPDNPQEFKVLLGLIGRETHLEAIRKQNPDLPGNLFINRFIDYTEGTYHNLYRFEASGAHSNHLSINPSVSIELSPDGSQLASNRCGAIVGLCTSDTNGNNARKLVDDDTVKVWGWSPDGTQLAYTSSQDTPQRRGMRVYNLNTNRDTLIFVGEASRMPINASWAPDSQALTFELTYGGEGIYRANADGTNVQQIAAQGRSPQWSPDGQSIAYIATSTGAGELARYTLNDGATHVLTNLNQALHEPRWAPNGSMIAFHTDTQLMTIKPDGSNLRRFEPDYLDPPYTEYVIKEILWSPDSQHLAILSRFRNQGFGYNHLHALHVESGIYHSMAVFWFEVSDAVRHLEAWQ